VIFAYQLKDIRFAYRDDPVLEFDGLRLESSVCTALVGANGSGKTTLLDMLAFLHLPDRGQIRFFGEPVSRQNYRESRRRTGYVHQKPYLFHSSVRDNVEIGLQLRRVPRPERRQRVRKILQEFGLDHLADRYALHISGGEAQKVAIARSLVMEPDVLLLDEPFSHVDVSFRHELEKLLAKIIEGGTATVIFTTHDQLQAQMLAGKVYTLAGGRPVPIGLTNLFTGTPRGEYFDTGKLKIYIPLPGKSGRQLAVDANQIVLSRDRLESSMRNSYPGRITGLFEENGLITVTVDAGETFRVQVTRAALQELAVSIGDGVWLSFKSSSVHLI